MNRRPPPNETAWYAPISISTFLASILEITFHTQELLRLCTDESLADDTFGTVVATALRNRLGDIRAADSVLELLAGRPTQGLYVDQHCYRLEIAVGIWLTIVPNHNSPRVDASGAPLWERVRRVRVLAVGN